MIMNKKKQIKMVQNIPLLLSVLLNLLLPKKNKINGKE